MDCGAERSRQSGRSGSAGADRLGRKAHRPIFLGVCASYRHRAGGRVFLYVRDRAHRAGGLEQALAQQGEPRGALQSTIERDAVFTPRLAADLTDQVVPKGTPPVPEAIQAAPTRKSPPNPERLRGTSI